MAVSTDAPVVVEQRRPDAGYERDWNEIKRVAWLFGLLLGSSFAAGLVARKAFSPWMEVLVGGVDASIVLIFASTRYREISRLLGVPRLTIRGAWALVGLALAFFVFMIVYFSLIERVGVPIVHVSTGYQKSGWNVWSMVVLVALMPSVVEELAFRGVIQSALEHVVDGREAWIIQAALFSVLHLLPISFPSHFVMGLCFGYMRLRSRSLYPGMMLHASWNAFVLCRELYWS